MTPTAPTAAIAIHAVYGLAAVVAGCVLLITGHIDAATGVALIFGGLGLGSTGITAANAVTQANQTVPVSSLPPGQVLTAPGPGT